jgi:hypothetical protein
VAGGVNALGHLGSVEPGTHTNLVVGGVGRGVVRGVVTTTRVVVGAGHLGSFGLA